MGVEQGRDDPGSAAAAELGGVLHSRGYLTLLLLSAAIGIPVSVVAFVFVAAVHELEHVVWESLPAELGFDELPVWWPIVALGLAGVLVGLSVRFLPGTGGHAPVAGLGLEVTPANAIPGVVCAAAAGLSLGAVVGPEAPLIALGAGVAVLAVRRAQVPETAATVISVAGAAAAICVIFGNPLIAAVLLLEVIGLARRQAVRLLLPCLVSSGAGALVFTGLGNWTGLGIGALAIPDLERADLQVADLVSAVPIAAVVAVMVWALFAAGRQTAIWAESRIMTTTVAAGLVAGCSAAAYALLSDHSPAEVVLSGQATLVTLATQPEQWSTGALLLLLVCKGIAYAACLGTFRGGPVFPAIFLGAAIGVLASTWVPDVGTVAASAMGMAAATAAVTRLPVTSILLVVLLLGDAAANLMPAVILAVVTALVISEMLSSSAGSDAPSDAPASQPSGQ